MTDDPIAVFWFRQDLRLSDNPGLREAAGRGSVLPVFILDDDNAGEWRIGAAGRCWLHHSLSRLDSSLNGKLRLYRGNAGEVLAGICRKHGARSVHWNRCYEPWRIERDRTIKAGLSDAGLEVSSFNASLLWEPWTVLKADGMPYRVFTPFYRKGCLNAKPPREPLPAPEIRLAGAEADDDALRLADLDLLPVRPWGDAMMGHWTVGEAAAQDRLAAFVDNGLQGYREGRNFPAKAHVSRLSPHLHWGEISPNQAWHAARLQGGSADIDSFCSELGWREFSHSLLYHFPDLPKANFQDSFDTFAWDDDRTLLRKWQHGLTGIPIVDAGMRELRQTGYMHNRVRMIAGSFLVKNLLQHWRNGEAWFWDSLVDADLANNAASWQWVAGSGADAAPYFRIFNPVTQGRKFDAEGHYTRRFVPELKDLPDRWLFNPWEAPEDVLQDAGVVPGATYPKPIIDLKRSRERALDAYRKSRNKD
jgi:deoxyribodipyrimidine photo-lyase